MISEEMKKAVVKMYNEGIEIQDIMRIANIDNRWLYKILREKNVTFRRDRRGGRAKKGCKGKAETKKKKAEH